MGRLGLVLGFALVVAMAVPAAADGGREIRLRYDVSVPGPNTSMAVPLPPDAAGTEPARVLHLGGASSTIKKGETNVEVFVLDSMNWKAPARLVFYGQGGAVLHLEDFCFYVERPLPSNAARVEVIASPLVSPCPVQGLNYGPATSGEVLLVFT